METPQKHLEYWYFNDEGNLCIDNIGFVNHLHADLGFCNIIIHGVRTLGKIVDNVVSIIEDKTFIVNEELKWLERNYGQKIEEGVHINLLLGKLLNRQQLLMSDNSLRFLPMFEIEPHRDTKESVHFYFTNVVVKVTNEQILLINYPNLDGYVLKNQIINRVFELPVCEDVFKSPFADFCFKICSEDDERFVPWMTMNGYMLSRFQDPANAKAVILLDAHVNELDGQVQGGRGKSLAVQGLSHMRELVDIDGKEFNSSNDFKFGKVTINTNIVCINDLKPNENFENHFGLTEGITINEKYKPVIKLEFKDSPKRIFTSNHMPKAPVGNSTNRRLYLFELVDFFNKDRTVFDQYEHYFFYDWDEERWNEFTYFMLICVQQYLKYGLQEAPSIHIEERRLISEVMVEYIDFFDEVFGCPKKKKFHKKELYKEFISGNYVLPRNRPTQRSFTNRLYKYLSYKKIDYKETPANTKAYIELLDEQDLKQQEMITIKDVDIDYKTVDTTNKMTRMVNYLQKFFGKQKNKVMAVDLETTSLNPWDGSIVCLSLSVEKHKGYNVIFPKQRNKVNQFIKPLLTFLEDPEIAKVFHNYKFDVKFLTHYAIEIQGVVHDTLLLDYLLDVDRKKHGLKAISELHLGYRQISFEQMLGEKQITEVPVEELTKYAVEDTDLTLQLYDFLIDKLANTSENQPATCYNEYIYQLERELSKVIAQMEYNGIKIDLEKLQSTKDQLLAFKSKLEKQIREVLGEEINLHSAKQMSVALFDTLQLQPKTTSNKNGYPVDKNHLEQLKDQHQVIGLLLDYSKVDTLLKSLAQLSLVHPKTGRVHANFNQIGTGTGRFSSSQPNMQNIRNKKIEIGQDNELKILDSVRELIIPQKGWCFVGADYSQIELRVVAEFSQDPFLIKAYREGLDIHRLTASEVFGVGFEEVTTEQRSIAKRINFGLIYGMSPVGLSHSLSDITGKPHTTEDASAVMDKYFNRFGKVKQCLDNLIIQAEEKGYSETLFGRKRLIPQLHSNMISERKSGKRMAMNSPIQGTAADIIKIAIVKLAKAFTEQKLKAKLISQVHDEVLVECPENELKAVKKLVKQTMENAVDLSIPLEVDCKDGKSWSEVH